MGKIHIAVLKNDIEQVKLLVEKGGYFFWDAPVPIDTPADVLIDLGDRIYCRKNDTAMDCAVRYGRFEIVKYLHQKGAKWSGKGLFETLCMNNSKSSKQAGLVDINIKDTVRYVLKNMQCTDNSRAELTRVFHESSDNHELVEFVINECGVAIHPNISSYLLHIKELHKEANMQFAKWIITKYGTFNKPDLKHIAGMFGYTQKGSHASYYYTTTNEFRNACIELYDYFINLYCTDQSRFYEHMLGACEEDDALLLERCKIKKIFMKDSFVSSNLPHGGKTVIQCLVEFSVRKGKSKAFQWLISNGANIFAKTRENLTLLALAEKQMNTAANEQRPDYEKIIKYISPLQRSKDADERAQEQAKQREAEARKLLEQEEREAEIIRVQKEAEAKKLREQEKLNKNLERFLEMQANPSGHAGAISQINSNDINEDLGRISISFVIDYSDIKRGKDLGKGSFGIVYQGTWANMQVAVKELQVKQLSEKHTEEFKNEAKIMANLTTEHIVRLYAICTQPYCLVMEYMEKGSLHAVLHGEETLDWTTRKTIALDVAYGLSFIHSKDILHRDLKSLNVLINRQNRAKLTDFGLSTIKKESSSSTQQTNAVGTLLWMAPELFQRKAKHTTESDVYSYGVILYEIASGKVPFEDEEITNQALIMEWIKNGEHDDIPADCPAPFGQLIVNCWKVKPSERFGLPKIIEELCSMKTIEYRDNLDTLNSSLKK
ncbi:MAG: protein kinase [Gammaproteobacteria bacterium]